jgi:hypothetical protein
LKHGTKRAKTVAAAGTAEALGTQQINGPLMVKALDTNTDVVAIGNDGAGDVTVSNGLRLAAGEVVVFSWVGNLGALLVDSAVNGEGVGWICLDV